MAESFEIFSQKNRQLFLKQVNWEERSDNAHGDFI